MENPASWGTVEKAIDAAQEEFWQTFAHCDGPEPIEQVAAGIAEGLVDRGVVMASQSQEAEAAILEALREEKAELAQPVPLCGPSRVARIAAKLTEKGLAQGD